MLTGNKPELLSPAGSMESVYAAVNNGCNAVYLGGKAFSARQSASNFTLEELEEVCDYCHLRNVKVYVTVNTIYKDKELEELLRFVGELYRMGADALIMQDLGAAKLIRSVYPDFTLHASTQLTSNHISDVNFLAENGFEKVVLSRELSLEEIKDITEQTDILIETFIHGALCVSYSGQCIMSSILGGRSGNRGRCAQTCRLPYSLYKNYDVIKEGYLLCPKDIQTLYLLPELCEAGISSFKIEGRMKNPEYVAAVTGVYRKYIDLYYENPKQYTVEEKDVKILLQVFNRGGFSEGYYKTHSGSSMMSTERPKPWGLKCGFVDSYNPKIGRATIRTRESFVPGDGIEIWTKTEPHTGTSISRASRAGEVISLPIAGDLNKNDVVYKTHDKALMDALRKTWEKDTRKKEIYAYLKAREGEPVSLKLWDTEGSSVYVQGDEVQRAQNQPVSDEKILQQIKKTGATPFTIIDIQSEIGNNIYIGISSLNELRRKGTEALQEAVIRKSKREAPEIIPLEERNKMPHLTKKEMTVLVNTILQFNAAVEMEAVCDIYFEMNRDFEEKLEECIEKAHREHKRIFAALPRIYRKYTEKVFESFYRKLKDSSIDGFVARSGGEYIWAKGTGKAVIADYSLNAFNREAVLFWEDLGADVVTVSPESNIQEICSMGDDKCEMLVYGYLPLMTTHQCPVGAFDGDKDDTIFCRERFHTDSYFLKDRKGIKFPLMTDCSQCICYVLNSKPLFTLKFFDELLASPVKRVRLSFTTEGYKETKNILYAYGGMVKSQGRPTLDAKLLIEEMGERGSTKGHFFRGIE